MRWFNRIDSDRVNRCLIELIGWPYVFYVTGVISLLISATWILLVYDCPSKHPRIDKAEIELIENAIVGLSNSAKVKLAMYMPYVKIAIIR